MLEALISDLGAASRSLRRSPGFLVAASVALGLGLGATFFMFAVMNTLYLKPPPFPHGERLYRVFGSVTISGETRDELQYLDFLDLRARQRSSDDLAALASSEASITGEGIPERFDAALITPNLIDMLGVKPKLGRTFTVPDAGPDAERVAMISHDVWRDRYGSRRDIVGSRVTINGARTTIVGVLPAGFGIIGGEGVWMPLALDASTLARDPDSGLGVWVIGRSRAGIGTRQVAADLASIMLDLQREHPRSNEGLSVIVLPLASGIIGPEAVKSLKRQFAAACLTLMIACLTVATLLFVRATYRQFEIGMRVALGASPARIVQFVLCETVVIASFGLLIGLGVATAGLAHYAKLIAAIGVLGGVPPWWRFSIDWRVTAFAGVAAVISAVVAGLVPAIRVSRRRLADALRESARTSTSRRATRFMGAMVSIELAFAVALLCAAGLLARGAYLTVDRGLGISADGVMTGSVSLPSDRYPAARYDQFLTQLLERLRGRPGVLGAVAATALPGLGVGSGSVLLPGWEAKPVSELPIVDLVSMSRGFLSDMGGDVIVGREFDTRDRADSPPVAMVNEALATQYFAGRTPIGERIALRTGPESSVEWRTIVGVAGNINHSATRGENASWRPTLYMPLGQRTPPYFTIGLRGGGTPIEQSRILRETVQALDADLPVYYVRPLAKAQSDARAGYQLGAVTLLGFSAIGFVLAIFGLYAVLAFTVGQRTREIGIRRALGAGNWQIAEFVLKGTASQLIIGLVLGAVLTPYAVRHAITLMDGLPVSSAATYLIAFGGAILIALVASVPPALRALQVQPADVIRSE